MTLILFPKSFTGKAGLVSLKNLKILRMVNENIPKVIRRVTANIICFVILIFFVLPRPQGERRKSIYSPWEWGK
jgi:hypothetical protein